MYMCELRLVSCKFVFFLFCMDPCICVYGSVVYKGLLGMPVNIIVSKFQGSKIFVDFMHGLEHNYMHKYFIH